MSLSDQREGRGPLGRPAASPPEQLKVSETAGTEPRILARLPDLDVAQLDTIVGPNPAPVGARKIIQRVSTGVLVGVGIVCFVLAVRPMMRGNKDWKPEAPAPTAEAAPSWDSAATKSGAQSPATQLPPIPSLPPSIPDVPASIQLPTIPAAIQGPSGTGPQAALPQAGWSSQAQAAVPTPRPSMASVQAGTGYPVTPYPSQFRALPSSGSAAPATGAAANRPIVLPGATGPVAPAGYSSLGSPLPAADRPNAQPAAYPTATEPSMARLQGTIEKSTARRNYDQPRSSLY